ncbi:TVP38/TMEM64 family protein [Bacillus salacetis]|uniref:TVP38/TMEM64 family protein n=1 Tax=Bacillus salacetis TaxID=2315464 RepID=UPI003B9E32BA
MKIVSVLFIVSFLLIIYWDEINRLLIDGSVEELTSFILSTGYLAPFVSILLMIFQAVAAPIPSFLITGVNGMIFGVFWGAVISWVGAMLGAIVSYYLAKKLGFEFVAKQSTVKEEYLEKFNGKGGFLFVLIARLVPIISFDLISFLAGLTGMRLKIFLFATGIGMLPGTVAYSVIGSEISSPDSNYTVTLLVIALLIGLSAAGYYIRKRNRYLK